MALIVEGKMPTCCGFCCECLGGGSDAYYCNRAKRQISEVVPPYDKRMEWCPIIGEIPDRHGRIVDLDKVLDWLINEKRVFSMAMSAKLDKSLSDAPVIVEAME